MISCYINLTISYNIHTRKPIAAIAYGSLDRQYPEKGIEAGAA